MGGPDQSIQFELGQLGRTVRLVHVRVDRTSKTRCLANKDECRPRPLGVHRETIRTSSTMPNPEISSVGGIRIVVPSSVVN